MPILFPPQQAVSGEDTRLRKGSDHQSDAEHENVPRWGFSEGPRGYCEIRPTLRVSDEAMFMLFSEMNVPSWLRRLSMFER